MASVLLQKEKEVMRMVKRITSLALAFIMVITMSAVDVFALEGDSQVDVGGGDTLLGEPSVTSIQLSAKPNEAENSVLLEWTVDGEETDSINYSVQKKDGESYIDVATSIIGKSYTVTGLVKGETNTFRVVTTEPSCASNEVEVTLNKGVPTDGVKNLRAIAGYKCISLQWDKIRDSEKKDLVDGYVVYKNDKIIGKYALANPERTYCRYNYGMAERTSANFAVAPFNWAGAEGDLNNISIGPKSAAVSAAPCQALYVTFKAKAKKPYYKSAKGKKKGGYLYKNKTYTAQGFVCGRLRYQSGGKTYFFPRVYAKSMSMKYNRNKNDNYTREEAENFVNTRGTGSSTQYMAWVSLYQQHVYYFKGSKGNWKCINDWEVATGLAKSATATGNWKVKRKWKKRNSLSYWTNFYSCVSFHSWGNPKCFGAPRSGGCVRMTKSQAKWVYDTLPMNTKVIVY